MDTAIRGNVAKINASGNRKARAKRSPVAECAPESFGLLVKALKRKPNFERLCDDVGKTPGSTRRLVERAKEAGIDVRVGLGALGLGNADGGKHTHVGPSKVVGEQRVAIISDVHFGSKYCMRSQVRDFIQGAYDMGIRHFLCCGDVLEGCYRHAQFELSSVGLEDQTEEMYDTIPDLPITIYGIGGNHEATFSDASGLDAGMYIAQRYARGPKQTRWVNLGRRQAFVHVGGVIIDMWHPRGSCGANVTQPLRNRIASYSPGEKPDVLVAGHWHASATVRIRGVNAIALPCFQGPGGDFSNSLASDPAMGGTILSWTVTEEGNVRGFCNQAVWYFPAEVRRAHTLALLAGVFTSLVTGGGFPRRVAPWLTASFPRPCDV